MALQVIPTLYGDAVTTHGYTLTFTIEEVDYSFLFRFNERIERWTLNISAPNGDPIVTGAVVLHGVDLFSYADPALRPRGHLICTWKGDAAAAQEPGEFDLGKTSMLLYFERRADLIESVPTEPGQA